MNTNLIDAAEALAKKAADATMAHEALNLSQAALNIAQAAAQLHCAENPPQVPAVPEGGTD